MLNSRSTSSNLWLIISVILWFCSLGLYAFNYNGEKLFGILVLLYGLGFGWMGLIFHAYTNIAYWICVYFMLKKEKDIYILAIITFLVGLSAFTLKSLPAMCGGTTTTSEIHSWGWGAIFWISSYAILMLIAIAKKFNVPTLTFRLLLAIVPLIWFGIFLFGQHQYNIANPSERERYFSWQTAYVRDRFLSRVPCIPLDNVKLTPLTVIELQGELASDHDIHLFKNDIKVPLPPRFIQRDYQFINYGDWLFSYKVDTKPPVNLTFSLIEQKSSNKKDLQTFLTIHNHEQQIVWQAPLITQSNFHYPSQKDQYPNYNFWQWYEPMTWQGKQLSKQIPNTISLKKSTFSKTQSEFDFFQKYIVSCSPNKIIMLYQRQGIPDKSVVFCQDNYLIFVQNLEKKDKLLFFNLTTNAKFELVTQGKTNLPNWQEILLSPNSHIKTNMTNEALTISNAQGEILELK